MTFTFSHDHVGITVTPDDLDATMLAGASSRGTRPDDVLASMDPQRPHPDNLGTIIEQAEPGTWPGGGRAHA